MKELTVKLQNEVDESALNRHLEWFSKVRRDTGGEGEKLAAEYIRDELQKSGLEVRMHEFDAWLSFPRHGELCSEDGSVQFECLTHAFTTSTGPEGITAETVEFSVSDSDPAITKGKIALVDGICTPITVLRLSRAGAAGIVFVNPGDVIHYMTATTVWGTPSPDQLERQPKLPAVSIRRVDGERLRELTAKPGFKLKLTATVETGWYPSLLPEVRIAGSGPEADDFILVGGHYCSWEYGITDNATGVACLLELARLVHEHRNELNRSVRIAWWPGHSHGRYAGSGWYADSEFKDLAEHCVAYHNIDSPGVRGATSYVARHTTAEIEAFCLDLIKTATGQNAPVNRPSRAADQSFLANGVPSFSTYPYLPEGHEDRRPWTGGAANAWWWHSSADTLDKADVDILSLDTVISTSGVLKLASADRLPLEANRTAREIRNFADNFAQAVEPYFDASGFTGAAAKYEALTGQLEALAGTIDDASAVRSLNRLQMDLSRFALPLVYSRGGRYANDPAELSPIMRNSKNTQFPGLADALQLESIKDSPELGFVTAGLVRQMNRACDQLNSAIDEIESGLAELQGDSRGVAML